MRIQDYAQVQLQDPQSRWTYVKLPRFEYSDFPWNNTAAVWGSNVDFIADYNLQAIYPKPVMVYHDQAVGYGLGSDSSPNVKWANVGTVPFTFRQNTPHNFTEFDLQLSPSTAESYYLDATATISAQGVTFLWSRLDQQDRDVSDGDYVKYTTFRVGIGTGSNVVLYSLHYDGGGSVVISRSTDNGTTWKDLESFRDQGDTNASFGQADDQYDTSGVVGHAPKNPMNYLEFRLLAGRLQIWVGNNDVPYVFEENRVDNTGAPITLINSLEVRAFRFIALSFSAHPTKWNVSCSYDSPEFTIGDTYPAGLGSYSFTTAGAVPTGWSATINPSTSSLSGPVCYYHLDLTGPTNGTYRSTPFADQCVCLRAVDLVWQAVTMRNTNLPVAVSPEEVHLRWEFNPDELIVTTSGSLLFNNNRQRILPTGALGYWGNWSVNSGQNAALVTLGRSIPGGLVAFQQAFSGYGHTTGEVIATTNGSMFKMGLRDRFIQMQNPRYALPWMDGWNVFYAAAYLASLGHFDIADMYFSSFVPDAPFGLGTDLGSPESPHAYYLPVGDAGSVLTRNTGVSPLQILAKIAFSIGYFIAVDINGSLRFQKFMTPTTIKRTFWESDVAGVVGSGTDLNGCEIMQMTKDLQQVRNTSAVIGVNAYSPKSEPIVFKYDDLDSVYNVNAFNFLGYQQQAVWMDSQFASPSFAQQAAQQMYAVLRVPGLDVPIKTNWIQPDIFPLDAITVYSPRLGLDTSTRLVVMSVEHHVTKSHAWTELTGRFIGF